MRTGAVALMGRVACHLGRVGVHLVQHLDTGEGGKEVQRLSRGLNMLRGGVKHGSAEAMEGQVPFGMIKAEALKAMMKSAKGSWWFSR